MSSNWHTCSCLLIFFFSFITYCTHKRRLMKTDAQIKSNGYVTHTYALILYAYMITRWLIVIAVLFVSSSLHLSLWLTNCFQWEQITTCVSTVRLSFTAASLWKYAKRKCLEWSEMWCGLFPFHTKTMDLICKVLLRRNFFWNPTYPHFGAVCNKYAVIALLSILQLYNIIVLKVQSYHCQY